MWPKAIKVKLRAFPSRNLIRFLLVRSNSYTRPVTFFQLILCWNSVMFYFEGYRSFGNPVLVSFLVERLWSFLVIETYPPTRYSRVVRTLIFCPVETEPGFQTVWKPSYRTLHLIYSLMFHVADLFLKYYLHVDISRHVLSFWSLK